VSYRDVQNKTDSAVKREKILRLAKQIREARAARERDLQLDAYNYLNGKNHTI
jgi:hypothetical protein